MTRNPYERNAGSSHNRGKRMRADEVRRARQSRAAPMAGRQVQAQKYQPRMSEQFPAVANEQRKKRWTPLRLGLLAVGLSLVLLATIVVVPILIQMQRTAGEVFQEPDPEINIEENEQGTPVIVTRESDDDERGFDDNGENDEEVVDESAELPDWDGNDRINIALYGVDTREDDDSSRSDTIIIVTIDPETNEVGMMSIPRDLQVDIPDLGTEKINAAYSHGGRALTKAVVEFHFDIDIHYYAEVDFTGFINIVDTIGGVVIDNPAVLKDDDYEWTRVYFPTGPQHLDGERALQYVRSRYDDNDFARGLRQQQVLRALREQGVRLNLITRVRSLLQDVEENFRTDLSMRESLALARMANNVEPDNIQSYSMVECTTEDYVPNVYYYLVPDWDCIHGMMNEMIPPEDEASEPDQTDEDPGDEDDSDTSDDENNEPEDQVNYGASILVENGTFVDGLASQNQDLLLNEGYQDVDVRQSAEAGNVPNSMILGYGIDEATASDVAAQLDIDPATIELEDGGHAEGYEIIVVLGEDAPNAEMN